MLVEIIGFVMVITGIFDAIKYRWNAIKIRQVQTAKGHSRKFINVAMFNDFVRIAYGLAKPDLYILISGALAMIFMCEYFYAIYLYYPYRNRNLINFKKPSLMKYLINSCMSNSKRKRL